VDAAAGTLTVDDSGIGMSEGDLATNLGTIALSGSKRFAAEAAESGGDASSIIGQFGVGFYSAFMVGDRVTVASKSADVGEAAATWSSADASASYTLMPGGDKTTRGSKITIHLKEDAAEYLRVPRLKEVVRKYSNFVSFPIEIDGEVANGVGAVWARDPKEVTDEEHLEFYRHTFKGAWDEPAFQMHFRADAPIDVKCVLYFPSFHTEKGGMARLEPAMGLYSRKVRIEDPCDALVPDWMRFARGVVDSEYIPLSISREKSQNRRILDKVQDVVVRKALRFLQDRAKKDRDAYLKWYADFSTFLKEGACHDFSRKNEIAKLLYFDSSSRAKGDLTSLDEYVARMGEKDDKIYYLHAPSRDLALASPYYEAFKAHGRECLFVYNAIDDFVMTNVASHNGRDVVAAEAADFGAAPADAAEDDDGVEKKETAAAKRTLDDAEAATLASWMVRTLDESLESVEATSRLTSSPAVVVDAESGAMRRMMAMVSLSTRRRRRPTTRRRTRSPSPPRTSSSTTRSSPRGSWTTPGPCSRGSRSSWSWPSSRSKGPRLDEPGGLGDGEDGEEDANDEHAVLPARLLLIRDLDLARVPSVLALLRDKFLFE